MWIASAFATFLDFLLKLLGPILGVFAGWYWGQWQAGKAWKKKEFKTVLLLGLNHLKTLPPSDDPQAPKAALQLRTLFEKKMDDVFPNKAMLDLVQAGIERTTEADPVVRFPQGDGWFILNRVLNEIGEQFSLGTLKQDMGLPVTQKWYVFCLTFERDGKMHQFKPRILIMEKESFLNFPEEGSLQLESENHRVRVQTLRKMKAEYKKNPHLFMEMQISL